MRDRDGLRRRIETERVSPGNRPGASRRDRHVARCSRPTGGARRARVPFRRARHVWPRDAARGSTPRMRVVRDISPPRCSATARNTFTPMAKFGAATTPSFAFAAASRTAASLACQPVVPMTTGVPRFARRTTVDGTASAIEKSMATSASGQSPSVAARRSIAPAISNPDSAASDLDEPPHAAVADQEQPRAQRVVSVIGNSSRWRCIIAGASEASGSTMVRFLRDAA